MNNKKIVINALSARRGGAAVFLFNLIPHLAENKHLKIIVFCFSESELYKKLRKLPNVEVVGLSDSGIAKRLITEHIVIPFYCRKNNVDCLFQPDDALSPITVLLRIKTVILFHASIQFYSGKELGDSWIKIRYWRFLKQFALKNSTAAVTVSFCTKAELARGSAKLLNKVKVIYHGIDHALFNTNKSNQEPPFAFKYLLSVSNRNPHKNYPRLLQAYYSLIQDASIGEHLVLIGSAVIKAEEEKIAAIIEKYNLSERVHLIDSVNNAQLVPYYQNARAYIYTSLFDSFGLTPLEAMACGIPCAVSFLSALPETCGDAPVYFDPYQIESICTAMKTVLTDENKRDQQIRIGLAHSTRLQWKNTVEEYVTLIKSVT